MGSLPSLIRLLASSKHCPLQSPSWSMLSNAGYNWKFSSSNLDGTYGWNTSTCWKGAISPHQDTSPILWHKLPSWQRLVRHAPSSIYPRQYSWIRVAPSIRSFQNNTSQNSNCMVPETEFRT